MPRIGYSVEVWDVISDISRLYAVKPSISARAQEIHDILMGEHDDRLSPEYVLNLDRLTSQWLHAGHGVPPASSIASWLRRDAASHQKPAALKSVEEVPGMIQ